MGVISVLDLVRAFRHRELDQGSTEYWTGWAPKAGRIRRRRLDERWVPQIEQALAQGVLGCWIFGFRCLMGFGVGMMSCGVKIWAFDAVFGFGVWVGG